MKKLLLAISILILNIESYSQCLTTPLSIESRIKHSQYVFDGIVTDKTYKFNESDGHIYTTYTLKINNHLKGNENSSKVELIQKGGEWKGITELIRPNATFNIGQEGIFFTNPVIDKSDIVKSQPSYSCYFGLLSFIEKKSEDFNQVFEQLSIPINTTSDLSSRNKLFPPVIEAIVPQVVTAGTNEVITISGANFGDAPVGFSLLQIRNPDYTENITVYYTVPPSHIVSWSDSEIKFIAPGRDIALNLSGAGSGSIRVLNPNGEASTSSQKITVRYNLYQDNLDDVLLNDNNSEGGFTFTLNEDLDNNDGIKMGISRSLESWQCELRSNFIIDETTTTTVSCPEKDGVNLISFDDDCKLPQNLLAQTTQWYTSCSNGNKVLAEVDIILNQDVNWNLNNSPMLDEYDLESLMLHELGHVHGLGHVLDSLNIMYPAILVSEERKFIDQNTAEGAAGIITESILSDDCGSSHVLFPECSDAAHELQTEGKKYTVFPNPVENNLAILTPENVQEVIEVGISDLTGRVVFTKIYDTPQTNGKLSINTSLMPAGIYILSIKCNLKNVTYKIIKG